MTSAIATMPSSVGSGSTEHCNSPEAGPRGFTAVNITPPHSRGTHEQKVLMDKTNARSESSATSPDVSPRHGTAGAGRQGTTYFGISHETGSNKRRRSVSPGQDSPPRYDYGPPKRYDHLHQQQQQQQQQNQYQQPQHMADRALHALDGTTNNSEYFRHGRTSYPYDRPYQNTDASQPHTSPDGHVVDEFSRESSEQQYASSTNGFDPHKVEDAKSGRTQDDRKRKRTFANRVKTGCKTCRGRKKKCDEARPICNNCSKGGFTCQGYDHARPSGSWSKPATLKQPILLHSKEEDEQKVHADNTTPLSANPTVNDTVQVKQNMHEGGHDQSRPQCTADSATPAESRPPQTAQQPQQHQSQWSSHNQQPQHTPYHPEHLPPMNEIQRPEAQLPPRAAYSTAPQRDMSRPSNQPHSAPPVSAVPGGNTWPTHGQQPPSQSPYQTPQQQYGARQAPYPPPIDTSQLSHPAHGRILTANTANTASASYSSYEQKAGSKVFLNEDVERSRMLRSAPYNYFDTTLENERIRCSNALIRYNKLCKLSGTSKSETQAMLQQVFDPKKDSTYNPPAPCRIEGHLGPGVRIETGFDCTYGYNIRISDNVFIGKNTRIDDSARVDIGARSWISANVTILTNDVVKELVQRKGTDGQSNIAHNVFIGTEVVIGTGAVILPGVRVGRGCTIEPYAIVKSNLPDFTTAPTPACAPMQSVSY